MSRRRKTFALVLAASMAVGCGRGDPSRQPPEPKGPKLSVLPVEIIAKQRSTTPVSGSNGFLRLTIDDITRGQVMTSLSDRDGGAVLAATSLAVGDSVTFKLGSDTYRVTLKEMNNALVGEDFATFEISTAPQQEPMTEHAKIERLLSLIESAEGDVFIRNGAEYSPNDAAVHLRSKWQAASDRILTVEQFVEQIATKSSLTGEPYHVRQADGTDVLASEYLREKLAQIDADN